jgi:glycosyltransferase involved in cell wall biosynthesis
MKKRPTILFVGGGLPPPYGGISKFLSLLLPRLVDRGFETHLQLRPRGEILAAYQKYIEHGIHIHDVLLPDKKEFYYSYHLLGMLLTKPSLIQKLKDAAQIDFLLRKRVALRHWMAVSHVLATEKIAQRYDIDITHAHDDPLYYGSVGLSFKKNRSNTRYIHTIFGEVLPHTDELNKYDSDAQLYREPVKKILAQADLLLSISHHCAKTVEDIGLDPNRVKIISYTVDDDKFSSKVDPGNILEKYNLSQAKIILFVGQIRPRKGPQILIEAAPLIFEKCPQARIVFVGPGDFAIELKKRSEELGCSEQIIFANKVDEEELPTYFAACDVFVFPSLTPIECLGLSMVQAMLSKKPVVASAVGGIPEVVAADEGGFLVPPFDVHALAEKITKLLLNPDLAAQMGQNGYKRALQNFNLTKIVNDFEQMYLDVWQTSTPGE